MRKLGARGAAFVTGRRPRRAWSRPGPLPRIDYRGITAAIRESARGQGRALDAGQDRVLEQIAGMPVHADGAGGIYLVGGVGRGKSWIAEELFARIPLPKRRFHVHAFLDEINSVITDRTRQGTQDGRGDHGGGSSIDELIASMVDGVDVVLLDDFHVHDVADGRLLLRALRVLVATSTHMLLTSNYAPEELMPNPLFHESFRAGIDLIERHVQVWRFPEGPDHRQEAAHHDGFSRGTWSVMDPREPRPALGATELNLGPGSLIAEIDGECLSVTFAQLCERPWAARDYLQLAERFARVRVTQMPAFDDLDEEAAQRFAHLIDVLADRDLRLDVHSLSDRDCLAVSANLPRDAERMLSRLALLAPGSHHP